jgi:hypothetical protein
VDGVDRDVCCIPQATCSDVDGAGTTDGAYSYADCGEGTVLSSFSISHAPLATKDCRQ